MKKQLLTATIMLTGMFVLTPSIADAKSSMDSNLKLLWMNTDVAPLHTSARQGFIHSNLRFVGKRNRC